MFLADIVDGMPECQSGLAKSIKYTVKLLEMIVYLQLAPWSGIAVFVFLVCEANELNVFCHLEDVSTS